jgi:hypothetical protein
MKDGGANMAKRYLETIGNLEADMVQRLRVIARVGLEDFARNYYDLEEVLRAADGSVDVNDSVHAEVTDFSIDPAFIMCSDVSFHEDGHITEYGPAYNHLIYLGTMKDGPASHRHALYVGHREVNSEEIEDWIQKQRIPKDVMAGLKRIEFSLGDVVMFHNNHPHRLVSIDKNGKEYGKPLQKRG